MRIRRVLTAIAALAIAGCAGIRGDGSAGSLPAGDVAAHSASPSALPKPGTLFAAIFAGSLPGSVVFLPPPYAKQGSTQALRGPINVALTKNDSLIVAGTSLSTTTPLAVIAPPYTGTPVTIANVYWDGGMVLDPNDDIFMAQGVKTDSHFSYLKEYLAPNYTKSIRFGAGQGRDVASMVALPNGALAVGSVGDGPHNTSLPGSLAIYHAPFSGAPTTIASLKFVSAMTVVPKGLIVVVCGECFGVKAAGTYIALVAPPYTARTKILVNLPHVTASSITSTVTGDIFVKQNSILYHYAPPYSQGEALTKTAGAFESMTTAPSGDLFYGSTAAAGPHGQFAINELSAPYTGAPQTVYSAFGPIAGMTVSK